MALKIERFEVGKDTTVVPINRFLRRTGLRRANIISTALSKLGRDRSILVITYDDDTNPYVVTTFPGNGATDVATGTTVVIKFSEPIQPPTTADVEIYDETTDAAVSSTSYTLDTSDADRDTGGILRIVDSGSYLVAGRIYTITLKSTIRDEAGNRMSDNYSFTFSTVPDPTIGTDPEHALGQRALMTSGNRELIMTTKGKYTSEPVLSVTIEQDKVYGAVKDGTLSQNPDNTWNFTAVASLIAPAAGQYVHVVEVKQS